MRRIAGSLILMAATIPAVPAAEDRAADRDAIRAHIESIFRAFIDKDKEALRATHDQHWLGFLEGSRDIIRGIDGYMDWSTPDPSSPYGMAGYKIRDMDMIFAGDGAFVTFVADVDAKTPSGPSHRVLRIADFYTKWGGHWIQAGSDTELHPESVAEQMQTPRALPDPQRKRLLEAREAVWRAFFANDRGALERLVPAETITIESGGGDFGNQSAVLQGAGQFAKSGAKLVRLEFPKTDIQCYGYTAIVYSTYLYELEKDGKRTQQSGRVTEVFVLRNGQWVNPGWHMDSGN
jgi:ketosteroid isomerase-like protein